MQCRRDSSHIATELLTNKSLSEGNALVTLDPALVVGGDVLPSGLELVADRPEELALNSPVEDVQAALAEAHDLVVSVPGRVDGACAVLDLSLIHI